MGKTIHCSFEDEDFPASEFISTRYGRVHKTLFPHNEDGTRFVMRNGEIGIEKRPVPRPTTGLSLKMKMNSIKSGSKMSLMFRGK